MLFVVKSGKYAEANASHRFVAKVENLDDPEEELLEGTSEVSHCLPGRSLS
jgi:hypothetical protein